MTPDRIIIVGGGPVGLVAATALAAADIPVMVVEESADVMEDLRASTFHPPTLEFLDKFGVTQSLIAQGLICPLWQFRDRREGAIATFDLSALADETAFPYRLQCEQWKLTRVLRDRLAATPGVELFYGLRAVGLHQDADRVVLTVQGAEGDDRELEARYLIGADGARSVIRTELGVAFDGMTIPERYLSLSTTFAFDKVMPDLAHVAYVSDPDEWMTLLRTPSLWRVLLPTDPDESEEDVMAPARLEQRLQAVVASPKPYEVVHKTRYRVHERVAEHFVSGRVMLAGDAAHLNNPLGGMGMNGGIHDAINLAEKLSQVWRGADAAVLGRYERQRRKVAIEAVQAQALRNRQILNERDPAKRRAYYDDLRATADDSVRHKQYLMRSSMIQSLRDAAATP
ncbi:MAG TPA: FAD-dependent monooxygenase [Xanthobacteraceae bacterium]|jgi:3-(3-hydroxy-phenyl)propionate hydroxylase